MNNGTRQIITLWAAKVFGVMKDEGLHFKNEQLVMYTTITQSAVGSGLISVRELRMLEAQAKK